MTTSSTTGTRWRLPALVIAVGLVAAGCISFSVQKQVTNGTSNGPFVVNISCANDQLGSPQTSQLTFNAIDGSGQQTLTTGDFDLSLTSTTVCSFAEEPFPTPGVVVTIECVPPPPLGITCSAPGATLDVTAPSGTGDFEVAIRVTNDFAGVTTAPTTPTTVAPVGAAEPSIAGPAFTG